MTDKQRGLYNKFIVERSDASSVFKHRDCEYFVLDLTHDKHAADALEAYAAACWEEYPALAADLGRKVKEIRDANSPGGTPVQAIPPDFPTAD